MTDPTLGPSVFGARAAKELMLRIERSVSQSIARTGEMDVIKIAEMLEDAEKDSKSRRGLRLALAEFIGSTLQGIAIDVHTWKPLDLLTSGPPRDDKPPVKRF